jgi:hypothetical protein
LRTTADGARPRQPMPVAAILVSVVAGRGSCDAAWEARQKSGQSRTRDQMHPSQGVTRRGRESYSSLCGTGKVLEKSGPILTALLPYVGYSKELERIVRKTFTALFMTFIEIS